MVYILFSLGYFWLQFFSGQYESLHVGRRNAGISLEASEFQQLLLKWSLHTIISLHVNFRNVAV